MTEDNGFVERPVRSGSGRGHVSFPLDRVLETAANGKAVRVLVDGRDMKALRSQIRRALGLRKFATRTVDAKDGYLTVWAEKR